MSNNNIKTEPTNDSAKQGDAESTSKETSKSTAGTAASRARAVPNLFVKRPDNTTKNQESTEQTVSNQKPARKPYVPNLRGGRGGARSSNNLIQTHSILEAGPAESTKRYGGIGDSTESYSKVVGPAEPSSNTGIKSQIKSESDSNYVKQENSLLIDDSKENLNETELKSAAYINLKFESKEKQTDSANSDELDSRLKELFIQNEQNEKLILLQMPDNLNLNEMSDGKIGKLRVYKSGRVELCLNDEKYLNVSLSVTGSFLQEAAGLELSTNTTTNEQQDQTQSKFTNLGQIETKLVCSPVL